MSHVACNMSHCACHMSYVKCLCWFLGHAEQLLFWCLCSKVSICNYVTCHMLHVACDMWHVLCQMLMLILGTCWTTFVFRSMLKSEYFNYVTYHITYVTCHKSNAWNSLNNFCFHVWAQKWVFVIMSHFAFHMSHVICEMLMLILWTCWTTFVFMSMLKSEYL